MSTYPQSHLKTQERLFIANVAEIHKLDISHQFNDSFTWVKFSGRCHQSPKDVLCQVWLKLAKWFWKRRLFNFVNVFSLFRNYIPLEKGGALHLNKIESPLPKDALCQVWLKLAQWFWKGNIETNMVHTKKGVHFYNVDYAEIMQN